MKDQSWNSKLQKEKQCWILYFETLYHWGL